MKKYPKYKNSGIPWLGEIPDEWAIIKLTGVCRFVRGNSSFKKDELLSNGTYVALQYGKTYKIDEVDEEYKFYVNDEFYKDSQIVNYGDIIFISTSETIEDLGHSAFYRRNDLGLLGGEQMLLKPNKNTVNEKYLYYSSKVFSKELQKYGKGVKVYRFNRNDLKTIYTTIPTIKEQTAIANFLDYKLEKIDRFISKKKQLIELLDEQKAAILNQAVTKGLNPNAQMKPSGIEWLGDIPEHWEVRKLKYLMVYFKGFAFKSEDFSDNGIPIIKVSNIKNGVIKKLTTYIAFDNQRDEFESVRLYRGDIIISTVGSKPEMLNSAVGQIGIIDDYLNKSYLNQNTMCIRPIKNAINEDFARYFLMSKYMRASFDSISLYIVNQAYLLVDEIMNIKVVIPNITKQQQIVNYIETETTKIEKIISTIEKEIALVEEYKTALIAEAVTGKIDVRKWSEPLIEND